MKIILDNIVFSLQKSGGISTLWGELLQKLQVAQFYKPIYLEYKNAKDNIVRKEIDIQLEKVNNEKKNHLHIERFSSPRLTKENNKFLFFSSYYRTSSNKHAINVTLVHDFTHEHYHKGLRKIIHSRQKKRAINKADGIICISENTKKDLLHFFPQENPEKIRVIYNGVADHFFKIKPTPTWDEIGPNYGKLEGKKNIIFIGSRSGYKNFDLAVEVMALLPETYELIIVGSALTEQEERNLQKKLVKGNYTVFSNIDNATLNKIYNKCFALLYPSSYEGFGIPVLEAMKAGIPVIAQNCSSIPEVAGDAAILINNMNPINICEEILKLEDENYHYLISNKGLQQAKLFSWDKTMDQYLEFFEYLYKNRK